MGTLRYLTERLIGRAQAEGKLSDLPGEGQPLPAQEGAAFTDPVERAGFQIMAREGALPPEVVLANQAAALRSALRGEGDPVARKALMAKLADVEMRRAMRLEARRR